MLSGFPLVLTRSASRPLVSNEGRLDLPDCGVNHCRSDGVIGSVLSPLDLLALIEYNPVK